MESTFDYGDIVLVRNTRSPYWNHCGMVKDSDTDSETGLIKYKVDMGSNDLQEFSSQDLQLDEEGSEITEILG